MTVPLARLRPRSVRARLTLWSVGVLALALAVFGGALRVIVQANLTSGIRRSLSEEARGHQELTARMLDARSQDAPGPDRGGPDGPGGGHGPGPDDGPGPGPDDGPGFGPGGPPRHARRAHPHGPPGTGQAGPFPARILDLRGRPLVGWSAGMPWDADTFRRSAHGQPVYSTVRIGPVRACVFSAPIALRGQVVGVVQTAAPLTEADAETAHLTRALLTLIPLVLLIAGAGGALLTGGTLRPVRDITQAARRIEAESLSGRLAVAGSDEFSELASTFNGMLERLEGAFHKLRVAYEQERRFTADASHELRTPLTVIKAHTSLTLSGEPTAAECREALQAIDEAADQTNHLVQSLLLLARSDAGQMPLTLRPVSLPEVVSRAVGVTQTPGGPALRVCLPADFPPVEGDPDALLQVFVNLLANAARHTTADGEVVVSAAQSASGAVVTVADTGEGIAAEHLPHVFERFYRVGSARGGGGTGLGLAICREIVQAHHGTLTLESAVGRGTSARAALPWTQPDAPAGP